MFKKTNLLVIVLFQITICGFSLVNGENFTYIAQVLDKVIRLEIKVKQMENDVKNTNEDTKAVLENVNTVLKNKIKELKQLEGNVIF